MGRKAKERMKKKETKKEVGKRSFHLALIIKRGTIQKVIVGLDTSAVRTFYPDYFPHFASGLELRHIGVRPKGVTFSLGCYPKP